MGDFNIDLMNVDAHRTGEFLDLMYSYSYVPLTTRPTRIISSSATLIDNIFVNNIQLLQSHKQGILYTDITDHLHIFHIVNFIEASASPYYIKKRQVNTQTIDRFKSILNNSNWDYVTSTEDTQESYTIFHGIIQDAYNSAFPVKEIRVKQKRKHPWVSPALQISIKFKNKLYLRYR